jgi:NAD(P)H dehydrogenase (quinone)
VVAALRHQQHHADAQQHDQILKKPRRRWSAANDRGKIMSKVLVLYYSSYGHIEAIANAVAEGAREAGTQVDIKRVPELIPEDVARKSHYELDQAAPIAKIEDLANYVGAGTRFGRLSSQMANFLDQAGGLCAVRSTAKSATRLRQPPHNMAGRRPRCSRSSQSSAFRHGGCRPRLRPCRADDARRDHRRLAYGATTIAGGDGSRQPTANELRGARYQGRKIAETANKLHG